MLAPSEGRAKDSAKGSAAPLCRVDGLTVEVVGETSRKTVVENVSFEIRRGDYFALVGESGSGKSVTCHSLMRLLTFNAAVSGRIVIDGADVWALSPAELRQFRRRSVGAIFQDPLAALNPVRSIGSQLIETLKLHYPKASHDALEERALASLRQVHIPQPEVRLRSYPHQLSGGLNQRVMIALALSGSPPLLIADEPTTALDMSVQAEILDLLDELRGSIGLSVLMVTHDLGIVRDRADVITVMRSGRVVESGRATEVMDAPRDAYTRALIEAATVDRLAKRATLSRDDAVCLAFDKVSKTFHLPGPSGRRRDRGEVVAADAVTFDVRQGEIVALVGESGSGKTTAAKMAMGLVKADAGRIEVNAGKNAVGAQMVFQHPKDSLDPLMRVGAQLNEVLKVHGWRQESERSARISSVIRDVGLTETILDRRPTFLSGGEAQRVVIARALLLSPRLLIADEPLSAVDVCLQKQILDCFKALREKLGIAILLITHDLRIVLEIADRVVVMKSGRVVENVDIRSFDDGCRDAYTQKLIDAIPGRAFHLMPDTAPAFAAAGA